MTEGVDEESEDAQLALLRKIKKLAGEQQPKGAEILMLSEAYAWLARPAQPHGGRG